MKLNVPVFAIAALSMTGAALAFDKSYLRPGHKSSGGRERALETRIVGGVISAAGAYPAYAIPNGDSLCGATLIYEDILISAAHCEGVFVNGDVYIGGNELSGSDAVETIRVTTERKHPSYSLNTDAYDLMLIKLSKPSKSPLVNWNTDDAVPAGSDAVKVIGFGTTQENGDVSQVLLEVNVNVVDFATCNSNYGGDIVDDAMLCAAARGKDSCQGDSGGPMFNQQGTLVGIVSWGEGCASRGKPGVYARVSSSIDFINKGICELSANPPASCDSANPNDPPASAPPSYPTAEPTYEPSLEDSTYAPSLENPTQSNTCEKCSGWFGTGDLMYGMAYGSCWEVCVTLFKDLYETAGWECGFCQP